MNEQTELDRLEYGVNWGKSDETMSKRLSSIVYGGAGAIILWGLFAFFYDMYQDKWGDTLDLDRGMYSAEDEVRRWIVSDFELPIHVERGDLLLLQHPDGRLKMMAMEVSREIRELSPEGTRIRGRVPAAWWNSR